MQSWKLRVSRLAGLAFIFLPATSALITKMASAQIANAQTANAQMPRRMRASDADTIPLHLKATRIAYGRDSLQFGELRLPGGRGPFPVAIVIHGGCYLSRYATLRNTAALAEALTNAGIATWNIEYRRYDHPGGGWPGTFADVADGADYLRTLSRMHSLDLNRVITTGHSAGGQLALWLASRTGSGRESLRQGTPLFRPSPIKVHGVVALGPITDMREYQKRQLRSCGNPAIESVLGALPDSVPERVRMVSPAEQLPLRVPVVLVAGEQDDIAPRLALDAYANAARAKGDSVQVHTTMGEGHFDILAPSRNTGKAAIAAIKRLLGLEDGGRR